MKLIDLILEQLNIYSVDMVVISSKDSNFTDICNGIRGVRKIVTLKVTTPDNWEEYNKKRNDGKEVHKAAIKFLGSNNPKEDLMFFKNTMTKTDAGDPEKRIQGLISVIFRPETLKRV